MITAQHLDASPLVAADPGGSAQSLGSLANTVGSADWSRWTNNRFVFYDYVDYPTAGTNEIQFFTQPQGGVDTYNPAKVKTLEQTNMPESRSFGRVGFRVRQIRTHIRVKPKCRQITGINNQATTITSLYGPLMNVLADLVHQGVLLINIGQKEFWDLPMPFITCPPGFGCTIFNHGSDTTNSGSQGMWFQQDPFPSCVYQVNPEQLIEAGQTFSTRLAFDNANSPALTNLVSGAYTPQIEIGILFEGYVLRPMQ
jgi:hypothetical protein